MISFPCRECGHDLRAPDGSAGKKVRCPGCQALVRVPEAASADKGPAEPVRERVQPGRKGKKKKLGKATRKGLGWPVFAAIGAGVLILVLTAGGVVVFVLGWKPADRGSDRPLARDPKPPADQVALADIPAGESWQVEPDAGEAPAPGGRSAFVLADTVRPEGIYFGAPASGKVAVVQLARREPRKDGPQVNIPVRREWVQYDIKSATPVGRVELLADAGVVPKDKRPWYGGDQGERPYFSSTEADLSPSGALLAHRVAADQPFDIWSRDGRKSHTLALKGNEPVHWLRFLDDARLLVSTGKELVLRGVANDAPIVFSVALPAAPRVLTLSPGGQYCVAASPEKITWYRLKDGAVAGTIAVPAGQDVQVKAACHAPDGTKFALLVQDGGKCALYVWDTKTGRPAFGKKLIFARYIDHAYPEKIMYWATPRTLVIAGTLVDAVAGHEHGAYDLPASTCLAHAPADGRTWGIPFYSHTSPGKDPIEDLLPLFEQAPDKEVVKANRMLLVACSSLPRQVEDKLAANEKGNGWHPNLAVRVEVESSFDNDKAFLKAAAHQLADALAAMGIRVDPQAPALARLTIEEPKLAVPGRANLQMKLQFQGPEGNVLHVGAFKQELTIASGDSNDKTRFRARTLEVIGSSISPMPATLLDNPPLGQINLFVRHSFLPDGLPPRIARS